MAQPAFVKVNIPNRDQYEELLVGILFDQLNSNIQLTDYGNGQFEMERAWTVKLPQVYARIVALGIRGKNWFQYEQPFTIGPNNVFYATMQATTDKKIKAFVQTNEFKQPQVEAVRQQPCIPPITRY